MQLGIKLENVIKEQDRKNGGKLKVIEKAIPYQEEIVNIGESIKDRELFS